MRRVSEAGLLESAEVQGYTLPGLAWEPGNHSSRHGGSLRAVCVHRWAIGDRRHERLSGIIEEFKTPASEASAHIVYPGEVGPDAGKCVQMVRVADKAWTCEFFNPVTINAEFGDRMWFGEDPHGLARAARIVGFLCHEYRIPPVWTRNPTVHKGVCRHYDLGELGGGHTDPTTDDVAWQHFMARVGFEFHRGGYRPSWTR